MRRLLSASLLAVAALAAAPAAHAANAPIVVRVTADSGSDSLRSAITTANAQAGADTITFDFSLLGNQNGAQTITVATALPKITGPLTITGVGHGPTGVPLLVVNCGSNAFDGLELAPGVVGTFTGISITHCRNGITVGSGASLTLKSSFLGFDLLGNVVGGSANGIYAPPSTTTPPTTLTIGGGESGDGNHIAGADIGINAEAIGGSLIQNNRIGTNFAGTAGAGSKLGIDLGSARVTGGDDITVADNQIAGATDASTGADLRVVKPSGTDAASIVSVLRNRIGTAVDGTTALTTATVNVLDGGDGTVFSGNLVAGVAGGLVLDGAGTVATGNRVCLNLPGTAAYPSSSGRPGISIGPDALGVRVGGTDPSEANFVAGCSGSGVVVAGIGSWVLGNAVGLAVDGSSPVPNGVSGVRVLPTATNSRIGGLAAGNPNVIAGNDGDGVALDGAVTGVKVQGNRIGTSVSGKSSIPNGGSGVAFVQSNPGGSGPSGNLVDQNQITGNPAAPGIRVEPATATGDQLVSNLITGASLGIDLSPAGPTPNDLGDGDTGPNGLQNFPVISNVAKNSVTSEIETKPRTQVRVQAFKASVDGHDALALIGETTVTTDDTGSALVVMGITVTGGTPVIETATTVDGTSEFSPPVAAALDQVSVPGALLPVVNPVGTSPAAKNGASVLPVVAGDVAALGLAVVRLSSDGSRVTIVLKNTFVANATVRVGGVDQAASKSSKAKRKRLKAVTKEIKPGKSVAFALKIPAATKKKLAAAIKKHKVAAYAPTLTVTNLTTTATTTQPVAIKAHR